MSTRWTFVRVVYAEKIRGFFFILLTIFWKNLTQYVI